MEPETMVAASHPKTRRGRDAHAPSRSTRVRRKALKLRASADASDGSHVGVAAVGAFGRRTMLATGLLSLFAQGCRISWWLTR
jgi:hypothetical protein